MAARRTAAAAAAVTAAAVLLIVDQVASAAFVTTPEVVVMRLKRSAEPMRSFSFSGFNPNGQMAAFTGAAEYPMFANYMPQPSQYNPYGYDGPQEQGGSYGPQQAAQNAYGPQKATQQDSYGPPPSGVAEQQPTKKQQPYGDDANGQESGPKPSGVAPADSKEQIGNSAEQADDNNTNNYSNKYNNNSIKKQYRGKEGPSSNAEASFNAWFPIMFGVFPNGAQGAGQQSGGPDRSDKNDQANQPQQQQQQGGNGYERLGGGTTVIANSVSNGRNGVATSHAIAYGNPRSSSK
ncbi:Hypothetical protein CINCED_3A011723 [Cinara cedri]|uniref:Uncharacterized protein n=1 Tax=Cinara cedri TaxID=506608 RepID=A0A5E4NRZ8_9HEMI|nr:Hypothetical protein CINCED_3A011723 [Cinara cedri]